MSRSFRVWIALYCLIVFFTQHLLTAQESPDAGSKKLMPKTPETAENIQRPERHINLDVLAVDAAGRPVSGLQQQDFTILDNNQPQKITSFAAIEGAKAEPPVEVILLVDLVNTTFSKVAYERQELTRFLRQNNGQLPYPVTLITFSETGTQVQPEPSRDGNKLAEILASSDSSLRIIGRSAGFYGAEERTQTSFTALNQLIAYEGKKPGRKMLIWISPGWPMLAGPNVQYSSKQLQFFFNGIADFSNDLRRARITLYAVNPLGAGEDGLLRTFYYQNFLKGVRKANDASSGNLALQVLAEHSGGRVLNSSNDLLSQINSCVADASAFYEMSFDSAPAEHANEYHALTVRVDKTGVKTRTNAAYYAQP